MIQVNHTDYTVEPPNKGQFGSRAFVLFSEVVLLWEVHFKLLLTALTDSIFMYMYMPVSMDPNST